MNIHPQDLWNAGRWGGEWRGKGGGQMVKRDNFVFGCVGSRERSEVVEDGCMLLGIVAADRA